MKMIKRNPKRIGLDYMFYKVFGKSYDQFKRYCYLNGESIQYNVFLAYKRAGDINAEYLYKLYC